MWIRKNGRWASSSYLDLSWGWFWVFSDATDCAPAPTTFTATYVTQRNKTIVIFVSAVAFPFDAILTFG